MPFNFNSKEEVVNYNNISHSGCISTKEGWEKRPRVCESFEAGEQCSYPSRCVDYLTHSWTDEDLAHSWRLVTRQNNSTINCARLENASWRIWNKRRNNTPTLDPTEINWHKDNDTSYLYGPLLSIPNSDISSQEYCLVNINPKKKASKSSSNLKPALKKSSFKASLYRSDCLTLRPKIRFNTLVEQISMVNNDHKDNLTRFKTSFVNIKPIIDLPDTPSFEQDSYFDDYLAFTVPRHTRSSLNDDNMLSENYIESKKDSSAPLVQTCFNAVNSTFGVITWARKLMF